MRNSQERNGTRAEGHNIRRALYFVVSILCAVAVLYYLFSYVSFERVRGLILGASWQGITLFLIFSLAMSVFRTWRYALMLSATGGAPSRIALFLVVLVRNFFSDLLPARLGTLMYIFLINTRLGVRLDAATSTFALAMIFDVIGLVPLILIALVFFSSTSDDLAAPLLMGAVTLAIISLVVLFTLPKLLRFISPLLLRLKWASSSWVDRLVELGQGTALQIDAIYKAGIYPQVFLLSILSRFCKYAGIYFFLFAILSPEGFALSQLDPAKVFIGICASELSASLPISGFAGFGLYQGVWVFTFNLLGFPLEIAKSTALSHGIFTQSYSCLQALLALGLLMLPLWSSAGKGKVCSASRASFVSKIALSCVALTALSWLVLSFHI